MISDKPIFIEPNKLRIINFTENYITPAYIGWLNNKEVVQFSELRHSVHTYESCYQYWLSFQGSSNYFWAIEIFQDDQWLHVGNINSYVDLKNKIADIGIIIGEQSAWGKGFGLIAWKAVCDYLLIKCHMRKVTGGAMSANKAMLKIMQRAGMSEDGIRAKQYICEGEVVDICHYALFSCENSI